MSDYNSLASRNEYHDFTRRTSGAHSDWAGNINYRNPNLNNNIHDYNQYSNNGCTCGKLTRKVKIQDNIVRVVVIGFFVIIFVSLNMHN